MTVCDDETAQRLGRCMIQFKKELLEADRSEKSEQSVGSDKIGGNEMFSAQSAAEKHRKELQMLRSGLQQGDSSARIAKYNKQCNKDKQKYTSGQVLQPVETKKLVNVETAKDIAEKTTKSSTPSANVSKGYQHLVYPFIGNPRECDGYTPPYVKNEPENELNFFLTTLTVRKEQTKGIIEQIQQDEGEDEGEKKKKRGIFQRLLSSKKTGNDKVSTSGRKNDGSKSGLACSMVSRELISFDQLKRQVSSPASVTFKTKPVIIICHGAMSWRNQQLLVNLSAELVKLLDVHVLRFDFTGNGHSKGEWRYVNIATECEDLSKVIDFITVLGCRVGCIIGHSQGSASVLNFAAQVANGEMSGNDVISKCFVNLAGRYRVPGWNPLSVFGLEQQLEMTKNGIFNITSEWGEDERTFKVTQEHLDAYKMQRASDTAKVIFPLKRDSSIRVLTIHGYEDEVVPVQDAFRFDKEIANHLLHVINEANHNFNGLKYLDEMVSKIVTHYNSVNDEK